jgi:hypothetical protein
MIRQLTFGEAMFALMAFFAGIALLGFAMIAWLLGYGWQTGAFAIGSLYTLFWGWSRLTRPR